MTRLGEEPDPGWTHGLEAGGEIHVQGLIGGFVRDELIGRLQALREAHDAVAQVFDPGAIYGTVHLVQAAEKAIRAHKQDRAIARDLATEIACYAAGTDQISVALETVGLPETGDALVVVALGQAGQAVLAELEKDGFEPTDELPARDPGALERLGIPASMREAVPEDRWELLVVEHVALLDALR